MGKLLVLVALAILLAGCSSTSSSRESQQTKSEAAVENQRPVTEASQPDQQSEPEASQSSQQPEADADPKAKAKVLRVGSKYGELIYPGRGYKQYGKLRFPIFQGTSPRLLAKGVGHITDSGSPVPKGYPRKFQGTVSLFAHNVTSIRKGMEGGPFFHIAKWRPGDRITIRMPYGNFHYRVVGHKIVDARAWRHFTGDFKKGVLKLAACWPQYQKTHRYVVIAKLVRFKLHQT